jgi:flavin reductase (DIM6/NTAB) family NADH-FMN oxidoreductase RutF
LNTYESASKAQAGAPAAQPAQATEFDHKEFRHALGCFPTGVAIISTLDGKGKACGLTCNSFSSVSLDPPLVLWSLRKKSSSIDVFRNTGAFAINVLAGDQGALSGRFATSAITDKFEGMAFSRGYAGVPLIDDCVARFHCSMHQQHDAGDHIIFIGRVERFERVREDDPLVFCKGAYMMVTQSLRELAAKGTIGPAKLLEARRLVYIGMARLACTNAANEDFAAIELTLQQMQDQIDAGNMLQRARLAIRFFDQIAAAAHNEVIAVVAQSLTTLLQLSVNEYHKSDKVGTLYRPELDPLRWEMLAALKGRDKTAVENAVSHYLDYVSQAKLMAPLSV